MTYGYGPEAPRPRARATMPPGFYPDIANPAIERWWDGSQWTPETRAPGPFGNASWGASASMSPPPKRSRRGLILAAVVVLLLVGGGVTAFLLVNRSNSPQKFALHGTMTLGVGSDPLDDPNYEVDGGVCEGEGGYDDITGGAQVTVSDESGKTVAIGSLGEGSEATSEAGCDFDVDVDGIPAGKKFYKVSVTHRGEIQYTETQMRDGEVQLTLGDD